MNSTRWNQIGSIFEKVSRAPHRERALRLDEACQGDTALYREVDQLLALDAEAAGFLSTTLLGEATSEPHRRTFDSGDRIGPYRLVDAPMNGGMGVVFKARRDDGQFEREVAIKLIRPELFRPAHRRRFETERQILAQLSHPNIARLYDGGVTEDGQPYLIMEYIEGLSITTHARRHRLDLAARIDLMIGVCQAVEEAHNHSVIHRDLKPGNILIDASGTPKLLDFGIAHEPSPDSGAAEPVPDTAVPMTIRYASPEQLRGETTTTQTDVHALGIILYELLTGTHPYDSSASPGDPVRAILETVPKPPSDVVLTSASTRERGNHPIGRRRLRGDLDAIASKALEKIPAARYRSVRALAEDLERHLTRRPVLARPASWRYRAGRFVARNQLLVGAALLLSLSIGFAVVRQLAQAAEISRERDKAVRVSDFLIGLFTYPESETGADTVLAARNLLDQGAQRLMGDPLSASSEIQAAKLDALGRVYSQLGLAADAKPVLERALATRRDAVGDDHADVADSRMSLAGTLRQLGALEEADRHVEEALAIYTRRLGSRHPQTAAAAERLGSLRWQVGEFDAAERLFHQALESRVAAHGATDPRVAAGLADLAELVQAMGRPDEALPLLERALDIRRTAYGNDHPTIAETLDAIGDFHLVMGTHRQAAHHNAEALDIRQRAFGPNHPMVARAHMLLGRSLGLAGDYEDGAEHLERAIALFEAMGAIDNPELVTAKNNLAVLLADQGTLEAAESLMREVLAKTIAQFGDTSLYAAQTGFSLGAILHRKGDLAGAHPHYQRAIEIAASLPPEVPPAAYPLVAGGHLALDRGQLDQAENYLRAALDRLASTHPTGHWRIADAQSLMGACLDRRGDLETARGLLESALPILVAQRGARDPRVARTVTALAQLRPPSPESDTVSARRSKPSKDRELDR